MTVRQLLQDITDAAGGNLEKRVTIDGTIDVCVDWEERIWEKYSLKDAKLAVSSRHPGILQIRIEELA